MIECGHINFFFFKHHHTMARIIIIKWWSYFSSLFLLLLFDNFYLCQTTTTTATTNSSSLCPEQFENKCYCGHLDYYHHNNHNTYPLSRYFGKNRNTFITNCTDTNFNDSRILSLVPYETEILIFNGNNFSKLTGQQYQMNMNMNNTKSSR